MTFKRPYSAGLAALAVGLFAATAAYAEPTVNKGDNAWMMTSTVLVLLMTSRAWRCSTAVWSAPRTCSRC
jgi:Amt family ammonium transporter